MGSCTYLGAYSCNVPYRHTCFVHPCFEGETLVTIYGLYDCFASEYLAYYTTYAAAVNGRSKLHRTVRDEVVIEEIKVLEQ